MQIAYKNGEDAAKKADLLAMQIADTSSPVLTPLKSLGLVEVQQVSRIPVATEGTISK